MTIADESAPTPPRIGRPQKVDGEGRPTRERLLVAAVQACVEHGFEGVTLADIAERADVSAPAIYNHFEGKSDLLVAACQHALSHLRPPQAATGPDPSALVDTYLSPGFADARVLQLELHLASLRHPDVAELLATWHRENAAQWASERQVPLARVKAWYLLLLGLATVDAIGSLDVSPGDVRAEVAAMATALFPEPAAD